MPPSLYRDLHMLIKVGFCRNRKYSIRAHCFLCPVCRMHCSELLASFLAVAFQNCLSSFEVRFGPEVIVGCLHHFHMRLRRDKALTWMCGWHGEPWSQTLIPEPMQGFPSPVLVQCHRRVRR